MLEATIVGMTFTMKRSQKRSLFVCKPMGDFLIAGILVYSTAVSLIVMKRMHALIFVKPQNEPIFTN